MANDRNDRVRDDATLRNDGTVHDDRTLGNDANVRNGGTLENLLDATVYDQDGDKIGGVGNLYTDDDSGRPSWVSVNTGLFGMNETLIPLREARISGDEIHVPYEKSFVKDAPNVGADEHLSPDEERRLYDYYLGGGDAGRRDVAVGDVDRDRDRDRDLRDGDRDRDRDRDLRDGDRDRDRDRDRDTDGVVRHEERVNVGTEQQEAGRVRLRKHVVTETKNIEVPVKREEVRVERTPIADGEPVRGDSGKIGEDEQEIVLHEERPVIEKETVPVERVNVDKQIVEDTQQVQTDVAKEQIEVDEQGTRRDKRR